ncbi:cysteine proteinase [Hesseltinella vesiculosa]|uniref:ubiquitinyl hydrolase 1 n=1 Tax=Hesseltinella vesiculosa TaxID=101127 RepID=A0A1X2GVC9_9FUNG|nr:cysteine proteinase [Hesseltinella vesiculosa]
MAREDTLEWLQVDPDSSLLTELCVHLGAQGVQVEPLTSVNRCSLFDQQPVFGIILFLHHQARPSKDDMTATNDRLYFANQVIHDAYAVHALLSVLLNCEIQLDKTLVDFKQFTRDFSPVDKGLSLGSSQVIRECYNNVARLQVNQAKQRQPYHYISYIPFQGYLWELDGFKNGPSRLGPCTEKNWLDLLHSELTRKTESHQRQNISYSMWSLIQDRRQILQRKLVAQRYQKESIERNMDVIQPRWRALPDVRHWEDEFRHVILNNKHNVRGIRVSSELLTYCQKIEDLDEDEWPVIEEQTSFKAWVDYWIQTQDTLLRLYNRLGQEDEKHENYRKDTTRRQHDYMPFVKSYIEALHSSGHLAPLLANPNKHAMNYSMIRI